MTLSSAGSPAPDRRSTVETPRPTPTHRTRLEALTPLRTPSIVLQSLLAGWVVFGAVAIVFGFMQRSLLHRLTTNFFSVSFTDVAADQHRADALNGIFLALLVATGIAFLVWFQRAYRNLDALELPRRYKHGWAIGGWFVPFLNLVRPKQVADDIWASVNLSETGGRAVRRRSVLLAFWWGAWIAAGISGLFARQGSDTHSVGQALSTNAAYITRDAIFIVAAVLALVVVRRITNAQRPAPADE